MAFLIKNIIAHILRYNLHSTHVKAVEIHSIWKLIIPVLNIAFDKIRNSWVYANLLQVVVIREGVKNSSPLNSL